MDIVLEIFDTYIFDRMYSSVLPASKFQYLENIAHNATSAFLSLSEDGIATPTQKWIYEPASKYLNLEPSVWAYSSSWPRDNMYRQGLSLFLITWIFGLFVYFVCATLSYIFIFDKTTFNHPKYLKNQVRMEIAQAAVALPFMALLTAPCFAAEVRGYAKLYDAPSDAPFSAYNWLQFPFFILFTDFFIYWIHRGLHHPMVYKKLHKPHHKWIMPTPYASHAFHPMDGFAQSIPYHVFPFIFPLQKFAYIALFGFINIWTILIHDGEFIANSPIINGAACHSAHHIFFRVNFGQFTTLWDRVGGTYRQPSEELFNKETKFSQKEWGRQAKEMEQIVKEVEGDDDRSYSAANHSKKTL